MCSKPTVPQTSLLCHDTLVRSDGMSLLIKIVVYILLFVEVMSYIHRYCITQNTFTALNFPLPCLFNLSHSFNLRQLLILFAIAVLFLFQIWYS